MELQLERTELAGHDTVVDTTLFSEETLESIVPDACPDILRILDTDAVVCVKSREAGEGRAEIRGVLRTSILYLPDGGQKVCRMEVMLPFVCAADHTAISHGGMIHAYPRVLSADARMINPRKVYVRVELAMGIRVYMPCRRSLCAHCSCPREYGVQERRESCRIYMVTSAQEKHFTFSDDLLLPGSKPDMVDILRQRLEFCCGESKVIGNKLIFKGQAILTLLCLSREEQPMAVAFELPFSQVMEVAGAAEDAHCDVSILLNDVSCQLNSEDGRNISVSMDLSAQAVLREERSLDVVTDLYSTGYAMDLQRKEEQICQLGERGSRRQSVREVLETTLGVKSVVDCALVVGDVLRSWEGSRVDLTADVRVSVLFRGEDDELYSMDRSLPVTCQWEAEPDSRCLCWCQCPGEFYATPTLGGVEVRFPLDFFCRTELQNKVDAVCGASLSEDQPWDHAQRPSIVLRMVETGESLWEIAKAYASTQEDIMHANELADGSALAGKLLLIPKKR